MNLAEAALAEDSEEEEWEDSDTEVTGRADVRSWRRYSTIIASDYGVPSRRRMTYFAGSTLVSKTKSDDFSYFPGSMLGKSLSVLIETIITLSFGADLRSRSTIPYPLSLCIAPF